MKKLFSSGVDPRELSPLLLAYIGDAVYELLVRQYLVEKRPGKVQQVHNEAVKYVKADMQAKILHSIKENLAEEELNIVKKGRNVKSAHAARSASVTDYRYSTGFESLLGYLYLCGREERLEEIMALVYRVVEDENGALEPGRFN